MAPDPPEADRIGRSSSELDSPGWFADTATVLQRSFSEARDDRITRTGQALAYSLFLAIPSFMLVVLGVFSIVADAEDVNRLIHRAEAVIPGEAATLLSDSLRRSTESPSSGFVMAVVGAVLAVWTTTSAAATLMEGITTAFDRDDERSFFHKRALALVLVLCLVGAGALVGALLVLGPFLERWLGNATDMPTLTAWVWWTAQWPVLIVGLLLAFAVLLRLGPDVDQPSWRLITPGSVATLLIWLGASAGFALYTANFGSYNKAWGALSAVVVMLIWLWLTSTALLFGAEVNAEAQRLVAERTKPLPRNIGSTGRARVTFPNAGAGE